MVVRERFKDLSKRNMRKVHRHFFGTDTKLPILYNVANTDARILDIRLAGFLTFDNIARDTA